MPDLDVSEAFDGLGEAVRVERRAEVIDNHGMRRGPSTFFDTIAVVTQSPSPLVREAEMEYMTGSIVVHTLFRLRGPSPGWLPDIVWWSGSPYVVANMKDWSSWGRGYIRAECDSMAKLDPPPAEEVT